ncbi:helix-turn-helix domain-containing protein [Phenylobacterium soli]|uniref:Transcriptional regulator n=1 Tax=Phenylobacterium soli TaxID=2170551 RepID=A0A328AF24_9CAUL|nr:helix-turn-helix transcriptional regulator [Phenylobacterium soli]RAK53135.1 transcriptional regulator [Phenylobacterium soli]
MSTLAASPRSPTPGVGPGPTVGALIREWRERRRLSQLDLSCDAGISTRHLSFIETGRARPSREMVLRLAEELNAPLRARNALLLAAGFAPAFAERSLDDPALAGVRRSIDLVLAGHEPFPALVVDRGWRMLAANRALGPLLAGVAPFLLEPPVNVLRVSLHPEGLGPRIANFAEWRAHILERLKSQIEATADAELQVLLEELAAYPAPPEQTAADPGADYGGLAVPLQLRTPDAGVLSFFSTTTVFGTPLDVTLSELALETFLPADAHTAQALRRLA